MSEIINTEALAELYGTVFSLQNSSGAIATPLPLDGDHHKRAHAADVTAETQSSYVSSAPSIESVKGGQQTPLNTNSMAMTSTPTIPPHKAHHQRTTSDDHRSATPDLSFSPSSSPSDDFSIYSSSYSSSSPSAGPFTPPAHVALLPSRLGAAGNGTFPFARAVAGRGGDVLREDEEADEEECRVTAQKGFVPSLTTESMSIERGGEMSQSNGNGKAKGKGKARAASIISSAGESDREDGEVDTAWGQDTLLFSRPSVAAQSRASHSSMKAQQQHLLPPLELQNSPSAPSSDPPLSTLLASSEHSIQRAHLHLDPIGERTLLPRKLLDELVQGIEDARKEDGKKCAALEAGSLEAGTLPTKAVVLSPARRNARNSIGSGSSGSSDASSSSSSSAFGSPSLRATQRDSFAFGSPHFLPSTYAQPTVDPLNQRAHTLDLLPADEALYTCSTCGSHLAIQDELISKSFSGREGKAFLFHSVLNTIQGKQEERQLLTGLHVVADLRCMMCRKSVGWAYVKAYESSQKYKEGKFILEKCSLRKENGWM